MLGVYGFLYYCIFGFRRPEPPPGFSLYAVLVNLPPSEPPCCIRRTTNDERFGFLCMVTPLGNSIDDGTLRIAQQEPAPPA